MTTIICEPGKVPGWLDEDGNATSCVDDNPTPGAPKDDSGVPDIAPGVPNGAGSVMETAPTVPHQVDTGAHGASDAGVWLGVVLIVAALAAVVWAKRGPRNG